MNCNIDLHESLIESGDILCPFCNQKFDFNKKPQDHLVKYDLCCDCQDIINDNKMLVCRNCGIVQGYESLVEYVNFYENRHKLKRKSFYHREYHLNNKILDIEEKYNMKISYHQKCKIDRLFIEIGKIINEVNGTRKRMTSINFILCKVLSMMKLPFDNIPISKSKKKNVILFPIEKEKYHMVYLSRNSLIEPKFFHMSYMQNDIYQHCYLNLILLNSLGS